MKPTTKPKLTATTTHREGTPRHHFFASSLAQWKVSYDLASLIDSLKGEGYPFNVWLVPGDITRQYKIEYYTPQVDDATWLVFYGQDNNK